MKINLRIPLPDWPIVRRFLEWLNPGMVGQAERWGRVTRTRHFGRIISVDAIAEAVEDEK